MKTKTTTKAKSPKGKPGRPPKAKPAKTARPKPSHRAEIDLDVRQLEPHPLAELLPTMNEAEYAALRDDINANGQLDEIILLDGKILDGRHRYRVCVELKRKPRCRNYDLPGSPVNYIVSKANHRHMTDTQKACAAVAILEVMKEEAANQRSPEGKTASHAASLFGVSTRYVEAAKAVRAGDPKLFRECFEGRLPLTRAASQIRRDNKSKLIKSLHKKVINQDPATSTWVINCGDCIEMMAKEKATKPPTLIIADPPYNEGIDYGEGTKADKLSDIDYARFMGSWIHECKRLLSPTGTLVIIINDEWAAEHVAWSKAEGLHLRNWIKWYETFGTNCSHKFNRTSRHVLYFTKHPTKCTFNEEVFSRPSDRQTKYADARANPSGKLWDDVWIGIPRLVSGDERQPEFKTQLPLGLILPLVEGLSLPGDTVFDPFSGSGTTVAAAVMTGRRGIGIEKNEERVKQSRVRISQIVPGATPTTSTKPTKPSWGLFRAKASAIIFNQMQIEPVSKGLTRLAEMHADGMSPEAAANLYVAELKPRA
jgi:DNA modification methylase